MSGYLIKKIPNKLKEPQFEVKITGDLGQTDWITTHRYYTLEAFETIIPQLVLVKRLEGLKHALGGEKERHWDEQLTLEEQQQLEQELIGSSIDFPKYQETLCHTIIQVEAYYDDENYQRHQVNIHQQI